jgi:predicted ATPase
MGLHTGEPIVSAGAYVGLDVHRAARVMSAGHGGQVLLSQATRDLVHQDLPDDLSLRDLGDQRLKDLTLAQRLYQLCGSGLTSEFPPPKSLENRPTNLPTQPTLLIGREREIDELREMLLRDDVRLLTLTGPGGTGKTRLALQLAAETLDAFADGVWFVNLAALTDATLVLPTVATTLGIKEEPSRRIADSLADHLHGKEMLLLLDNFEQVADAAPDVAGLLAQAGMFKLLVTSRARLQVSAEHEYPVQTLTENEALALFTERARAVKPSFSLNGNSALVYEICRRLDCLPLAIELAAARIKLLPERALLERLDNRLKLLAGGGRDLPARQQTLRAAIEWSYGLLTRDEQTLFARLAVFAGGRTLEAIEAVCNPEGDLDVLEEVASLVDKSLLRQEESEDAEPRFVMLETIHEFAWERLLARDEVILVRQRHAEWFAAFAEEVTPHLPMADAGVWFDRLEKEQDNIRLALEWALSREDVDTARHLVAPVRYWHVRGMFDEGRRHLERVLALTDAGSEARGRVLIGAAALAGAQDDHDRADAMCAEAITICQEHGLPERTAVALNSRGVNATRAGRYEVAAKYLEESLRLQRTIGNEGGAADALLNLASIAVIDRRPAEASARLDEALATYRRLGDHEGVAIALGNIGRCALLSGDAHAAWCAGDEVVATSGGLGYSIGQIYGLEIMAAALARTGRLATAAAILGASERLLATVGVMREAAEQATYEETRSMIEAGLDVEEQAHAQTRGATLSVGDAVELAKAAWLDTSEAQPLTN